MKKGYRLKKRFIKRNELRRLKANEPKFSPKAKPICTSKSSITTLETANQREMYLPCTHTKNKLKKATMLGKKIIHYNQYQNAVTFIKGIGLKDYWNYM